MNISTKTNTTTATVQFKLNLELTENEARAWDAIVGYGFDAFIKVFKEKLGSHYISPYEADAKKMFEDTRQELGRQLHAIDEVKKQIANINNKSYIKVKP